jgi:hypothetical protein
MTPEEFFTMPEEDALRYLDEVMQKRNEFQLRLQIVMASDTPPRLKNYRIKLITREIVAVKEELQMLVVLHNVRLKSIVPPPRY